MGEEKLVTMVIATKYCNVVVMYIWQSRVEIEHYSVVYFDCVATLEAL